MKLRLQPIRVYCFHQVSEVFDAESMWECDWMSVEEFQKKVTTIQHECTLISLQEAHNKLSHDIFRFKKYAVLTSDDGSKTIESILPWLIENNIPVTLFINGKYTDSKSYRDTSAERYLTESDLVNWIKNESITLESHGYEHKNATTLTVPELEKNILENVSCINNIYQQGGRIDKVKFHAYTWGKHSVTSDAVLQKCGILPVLIDGMDNINSTGLIHRRLL